MPEAVLGELGFGRSIMLAERIEDFSFYTEASKWHFSANCWPRCNRLIPLLSVLP